MAASSTLIVDTTSLITNGPNSASLALSIAPAGPIQDSQGNARLAKLKLQEASLSIAKLLTVTDAGDGSKATITAVGHALDGLSAPSTTLLTDMATVITNGPSAASLALAIAPAGPIMDYAGMCHMIRRKLQEAKLLFNAIDPVTDASDATNKALVASLKLALV